MPDIDTLQNSVRAQTVIVGAGPAGLAIAGCLAAARLPFVLLDQADKIGAAWHTHYDRLHLHTDKAHSHLPHLPFPKHYPTYLSRLQFIEYLESYARHFELQPVFGQTVAAIHFHAGQWEIDTQDTRYIADAVVVATGNARQPYCPTWPGQESFEGTLLHSSQYQNGSYFKGQHVLVVGFGNSGGEIAIDLWEHGAKPIIAVRSPVNVLPRTVLGVSVSTIATVLTKLPTSLADRLVAPVLYAIFGNLRRIGLQPLPYGPLTQIRRDGRIPLIDVGTIALVRRGKIALAPGVKRFTHNGVIFTDGSEQRVDAVLLATGYRAQVDALFEHGAAVVDGHGNPANSGRVSPMPGLYFCGFEVSPVGMLYAIAREAEKITQQIQRHQAMAPEDKAAAT